MNNPPTELTETQMAYNVASSDMFQLAAYGHHRYHPSGEALTDEGKRQQRDYNDRLLAARSKLESAVLRLVAEHAETFRGDWGVVANWLRSVAGDPEYLSLMAVRPDERDEILDGRAAPSAGLVAVPPTTADRDRIADAIRAAACPGDCGTTEEECARERIQPLVWHHGRLAGVEGSPEQFADAVLGVWPAGSEGTAATRAAVLREAATIVRSMDSDYALQEAAEHLDGLAVEVDEEQEAQAHLDALVPIAEGAPLPDLDGPALYEKLTAMFSGPLPWPPPDSRPDLVTFRERIAEDLYAHDHPNWRVPLRDSDVEPVYRERAAAVVAGVRQLVAAVGIPSSLATETPTAELAEQIGLRDYWHREAMSATSRIIELEGHLEELRRLAAETQPDTEAAAAPVHVGGRVNAEDCPACIDPPYPFICPGPESPQRSRTARLLDAVTHSGPGYDLNPAASAGVQPTASTSLTPVGGVKGNPFDYHPEDEQQPASAGVQTDEEADRIVAYRSPQGRSLYCTRHVDELFGAVFTPVTSDDLPDGGLCTFPDCGADVLIQQQTDEEA